MAGSRSWNMTMVSVFQGLCHNFSIFYSLRRESHLEGGGLTSSFVVQQAISISNLMYFTFIVF